VKRTFSARVTQEENWFVAQCLDVDVASQGKSKHEALENLKEALELFFDEPAASLPEIEKVEIEIGVA
jgi:predicted RNase H-like HicB family nuclease